MKNRTTRVAALLLALTLITSCFVGGTFAKYVREAEGYDVARAAKWGVTIESEGNMFSNTYATDNQEVVGTIANSVVSTENVVAPGTSGSMSRITLSGTPEVAVEVKYVADLSLTNWEIDGTFYCPLLILVGDTLIAGYDYTSAADMETAVENAIEDCTALYEAGTDLSTAAVNVPSVFWMWVYEDNAENDVKDTALGDQAAAGNAATVELTITTTVTQID